MNKPDIINQNNKWKVMNCIRNNRPKVLDKIAYSIIGAISIGYGEMKNYETYYFSSDEDISIAEPENIHKYPSDFRTRLLDRHIGEHVKDRPYVSVIPDCYLIGKYPIPIKSSMKIIYPSIIKKRTVVVNFAKSLNNFELSWSSLDMNSNQKNIQTAILLFNGWSENYFHWMIDDLTRLQYMSQIIERYSELKIIVPNNLKSWQKESLDLLGVPDERIYQWDRSIMHLDNLIVPRFPRQTNDESYQRSISKKSINWLSNEILSRTNDDTDFCDRVFISREDATRRKILNQNNVNKLLDKYGFENYVLTDLSVGQQAKLFNQAEIIISPHGANLTNLIFSDRATVIELFSGNYYDSVFFILSQYNDCVYDCIKCETVNQNIVVDVERLRKKLVDHTN